MEAQVYVSLMKLKTPSLPKLPAYFFITTSSRKTKCTPQILLVILHLVHVCWLVQIQIVRVFATFMVCWSVKCVLPSSTSRIASETKIISALNLKSSSNCWVLSQIFQKKIFLSNCSSIYMIYCLFDLGCWMNHQHHELHPKQRSSLPWLKSKVGQIVEFKDTFLLFTIVVC